MHHEYDPADDGDMDIPQQTRDVYCVLEEKPGVWVKHKDSHCMDLPKAPSPTRTCKPLPPLCKATTTTTATTTTRTTTTTEVVTTTTGPTAEAPEEAAPAKPDGTWILANGDELSISGTKMTVVKGASAGKVLTLSDITGDSFKLDSDDLGTGPVSYTKTGEMTWASGTRANKQGTIKDFIPLTITGAYVGTGSLPADIEIISAKLDGGSVKSSDEALVGTVLKDMDGDGQNAENHWLIVAMDGDKMRMVELGVKESEGRLYVKALAAKKKREYESDNSIEEDAKSGFLFQGIEDADLSGGHFTLGTGVLQVVYNRLPSEEAKTEEPDTPLPDRPVDNGGAKLPDGSTKETIKEFITKLPGIAVGKGSDATAVKLESAKLNGKLVGTDGVSIPAVVVPQTFNHIPSKSSKRWLACAINGDNFIAVQLIVATSKEGTLHVAITATKSATGYKEMIRSGEKKPVDEWLPSDFEKEANERFQFMLSKRIALGADQEGFGIEELTYIRPPSVEPIAPDQPVRPKPKPPGTLPGPSSPGETPGAGGEDSGGTPETGGKTKSPNTGNLMMSAIVIGAGVTLLTVCAVVGLARGRT